MQGSLIIEGFCLSVLPSKQLARSYLLHALAEPFSLEKPAQQWHSQIAEVSVLIATLAHQVALHYVRVSLSCPANAGNDEVVVLLLLSHSCYMTVTVSANTVGCITEAHGFFFVPVMGNSPAMAMSSEALRRLRRRFTYLGESDGLHRAVGPSGHLLGAVS